MDLSNVWATGPGVSTNRERIRDDGEACALKGKGRRKLHSVNRIERREKKMYSYIVYRRRNWVGQRERVCVCMCARARKRLFNPRRVVSIDKMTRYALYDLVFSCESRAV